MTVGAGRFQRKLSTSSRAVHSGGTTSAQRPGLPAMTSLPDHPLTVTDPAGLTAAIPAILGFHPYESLVLAAIGGEPPTLGPVGRIDLPGPSQTGAALDHLVAAVGRHA